MGNILEISYNLEKMKSLSFNELLVSIEKVHNEMQNNVIKAVNKTATVRNYIIGFYIVEYEQQGKDRATYGEKLLKTLAERINKRGLNETLFKVSRQFYLHYPQIKDYLSGKSATLSHQFTTPAEVILSHLSFNHIREILTLENDAERFFYESECIKCCWSVRELRRQISTNLFFRSEISKYPEKLLSYTHKNTVPQLTLKEPFCFEFLDLRPDYFTENDLENELINHLKDFLLELGKGFCFEARQKRMIIDDEYYFADLVFYNRILHCNIIIELKDDEFKHSDLSQLNAYVSYFRKNEMNVGDNPPVGILLCTRKGKEMVEYALAGLDNKIFVQTYMLTLPDKTILENFLKKEMHKKSPAG